jgi:small-conductance mechanosensitive channel/CRP-like cAMP-binding protein
MPSSEIQRKTFSFLVFAALIIAILVLLPTVEEQIISSIRTHFQLGITPEGAVTSPGGESPAKMAETALILTATLLQILRILLGMALVIGTVRFVGHIIGRTVYRKTAQAEIPSLLRTVVSVAIYIVAFFIIFQSQFPGVPLAPLFTGSTIIGIVVGLALQDTLGNLFAGLALQADQPFGVGDVIIIPGRGEGVVELVSWRGVKVRTFQNKLLVVSNSVLGKEIIEVAPKGNLNAKIVHFNSLYSSSPARTIRAVRDAVRHVDNVSDKIRPVVRIRNLGENGIDWEVKYWMNDYTLQHDTDALIRQRIWYVFNRENIEFAYPTRTLYVQPKRKETPEDQIRDHVAERLSHVDIFSPLSQDETQQLASACVRRVYAPGEAIVRKGQDGSSMFVITKGTVKVQIPENGYDRTINTLGENDFFGEMSLLTGQPRSANVIATEETDVLQIKKVGIKPIFENNPDLVSTIFDLVEERKQLLSDQDVQQEGKTEDKRSVVTSIKKFFGLA